MCPCKHWQKVLLTAFFLGLHAMLVLRNFNLSLMQHPIDDLDIDVRCSYRMLGVRNLVNAVENGMYRIY